MRHPLAEYLRECGYSVVQVSNTDEARKLLADCDRPLAIDLVLADVNAPGGESALALATWIRASHSGVQVILEGTVEDAAERAHELCENGRALSKPYDHQLPLDRIRRLRAARDQAERDGSV